MVRQDISLADELVEHLCAVNIHAVFFPSTFADRVKKPVYTQSEVSISIIEAARERPILPCRPPIVNLSRGSPGSWLWMVWLRALELLGAHGSSR